MQTRLLTLLAACLVLAAAAPAPKGPEAGKTLPVAPPPEGFGGTSLRVVEPGPAAPARPPEAPMSLTASDGTGLKLVALSARAVVEEPLAFTELKLAFQNPEDRVIEGQFRITLPQGATVSRFAMRMGDRWQEGEVVEKQAARRAYEDFLHRRQDPALLEQAAGNEFGARVFPIPARGVKELILSYSQELPTAATPYVLPLRGLPELGELDAVAWARGQKAGELKKSRYVPSADFVVEARPQAARSGLRNGNLALARVKPMAESRPDEIPSAIVLVDTSASRALGFGEQVRLVEKLVRGLAEGAGAKTPVAVACFDQTIEVVYDGAAGGFGDLELKRIKARRALGASDLQRALKWAAERAAKGSMKRVLLVSDGVATAGAVEGDELRAAALKLKGAGVERLDAVALGGIRDDALLRRLATAGLPRDGVVADGGESFALLARRLTEATRSNLEVKVEGASWWWPRKIGGVQAGEEVLVYADLPANAPMRVSVGGSPAKVFELPTVERPLLERAWVQTKIASLEHKMDVEADGAQQKAALQKEIVDLSVKHRVLSRYTALLVLETEGDYARFNIDRRALADILTVDAGGRVALTRRAAEPAQPKTLVAADRPAPKPAPREEQADKKSLAKGGEPAKDLALADEDQAEEREAPAPMMKRKASAAPRADAPAGLPPPAPMAAPAPAPAMEAAEPMPEARAAAPAGAVAAPQRSRRPSPSSPPAPPPPSGSFQRGGPQQGVDPYTGRFKEVMDLVRKKDFQAAYDKASGWREEDPADVMALVALGQVCEARGDVERAARAYGSIIDLFAARADLRRFAGERLEKLKLGLELAADSFAKAVAQRPDHPASHRLLAYALLKRGQPAQAFAAIAAGLKQQYPGGRFAGVQRILAEDVGLIGAAWIKAEPGKRQEILNRLRELGAQLEDKPSIRFVLNWETDANDVDFHIYDSQGNHAYYGARQLASGGELYADVTTGYGPECFTIRQAKGQRAYPYTLQAHYYSRGPMGYGMGKVQILDHDGNGGIAFEERPFVVMVDRAFVDMGTVTR